jgi:hypothetical protein
MTDILKGYICMKHGLEKRIQTLEEGTKPRVLSTLLDLINCIEENEDVELSPELQELVEMAADEAH